MSNLIGALDLAASCGSGGIGAQNSRRSGDTSRSLGIRSLCPLQDRENSRYDTLFQFQADHYVLHCACEWHPQKEFAHLADITLIPRLNDFLEVFEIEMAQTASQTAKPRSKIGSRQKLPLQSIARSLQDEDQHDIAGQGAWDLCEAGCEQASGGQETVDEAGQDHVRCQGTSAPAQLIRMQPHSSTEHLVMIPSFLSCLTIVSIVLMTALTIGLIQTLAILLWNAPSTVMTVMLYLKNVNSSSSKPAEVFKYSDELQSDPYAFRLITLTAEESNDHIRRNVEKRHFTDGGYGAMSCA